MWVKLHARLTFRCSASFYFIALHIACRSTLIANNAITVSSFLVHIVKCEMIYVRSFCHFAYLYYQLHVHSHAPHTIRNLELGLLIWQRICMGAHAEFFFVLTISHKNFYCSIPVLSFHIYYKYRCISFSIIYERGNCNNDNNKCVCI